MIIGVGKKTERRFRFDAFTFEMFLLIPELNIKVIY